MKNKKYTVLAVAAVLMSLVGCSSTSSATSTVIYYADYPYYASMEQLAQQADMVIRGTMLSSRVESRDDSYTPNTTDPVANPGGTAKPDPVVYTIYTFKISDCYKGCDTPGTTVDVKQLGGVLENVTYSASEVPFKVNKKYILFLATFDSSPAELLNPVEAAYAGDPDSSGAYGSADPGSTWKIAPGQLKKLFGK